ncbi:MAG: anaerobic ribonucleoside-triphosphate reductase activating protein [Chitinispirillales bacterium]|nr:anaerobic ribonucleoside-triphosphate reductase activating protein [Chitinispirillales bacterium]
MSSVFNGICGLNKFSGNDFPGAVSAVLFYSDCNLRCPYCQNPDIVLGNIKPIDYDELDDFLRKRRHDIDGIVITGGEPTINKNLPPLIDYIRTFGYKIKLDTNGLNPAILKNCAPDYLALDIKTTAKKYEYILGSDLSESQIKENLQRTVSFIKKHNGELRITVAPKVIEINDFEEIAEYCSGMNVFLQKFRTKFEILNKNFFEGKTCDDSFLHELKNYLEKSAKSVKIRNYGENSKVSDKKHG